MSSTACKSCGAGIVWIRDTEGRWVACDPETFEALTIGGIRGKVRKVHAATCASRDDARRRDRGELEFWERIARGAKLELDSDAAHGIRRALELGGIFEWYVPGLDPYADRQTFERRIQQRAHEGLQRWLRLRVGGLPLWHRKASVSHAGGAETVTIELNPTVVQRFKHEGRKAAGGEG